MGRWKDDGSGNPVWDANDSGPDQIAGPAGGGFQGGDFNPYSGGSGGFSAPNGGVTGGAGAAQAKQQYQQQQGGGFQPPNVWAGPEEIDPTKKPGWGPIKINTVFNPGEGFAHPFEDWIPGNGVGKFGEKDNNGTDNGNAWWKGGDTMQPPPGGSMGGGGHVTPITGPGWDYDAGGNRLPSFRDPGSIGGLDVIRTAPANNPNATPEAGYWRDGGMHTMQYTPAQAKFDEHFQNYWAPDRAQVLESLRGGSAPSSGGMDPLLEELMKRFRNNPDVRY